MSTGILGVVSGETDLESASEQELKGKLPRRKTSPTNRALKRIHSIERSPNSPASTSPKLSLKPPSPRKIKQIINDSSKIYISESLFWQAPTDPSLSISCRSERNADMEEIKNLCIFTDLNFEDPLNIRLITEVAEGSVAMLLAIRHGLFMKAYGLICKGSCPQVTFNNGDVLGPSDFIFEIAQAYSKCNRNFENQNEKELILDLISKIHQASGSQPEILQKAKSLAHNSNNHINCDILDEFSSFVPRLYPVSEAQKGQGPSP